ncbi:ferric reductase-like transmembrane domain-containing protein [Ruegeria arenilitoris]|uniref:ferric reductase-like transmembrane domain-containing protein n=1 Tax=Ruegeria arenilitoris TaxID=1173585 RepID=UPI00147C7353
MPRPGVLAVWLALIAAIAVPVVVAGFSPYLAWRSSIYIAAGFAGVIGLGLLLVQPLLAARMMPGLTAMNSRMVHRWVGIALIAMIALHVGGLWITSPPDVVDAMLFRSPTSFSAWGVAAMWAAFAAAALAALRSRLGWRFRPWRLAHASLALVTILGTVVHALLIEGTMETVTKAALCGLVLFACVGALIRLQVWDVKPRG